MSVGGRGTLAGADADDGRVAAAHVVDDRPLQRRQGRRGGTTCAARAPGTPPPPPLSLRLRLPCAKTSAELTPSRVGRNVTLTCRKQATNPRKKAALCLLSRHGMAAVDCSGSQFRPVPGSATGASNALPVQPAADVVLNAAEPGRTSA